MRKKKLVLSCGIAVALLIGYMTGNAICAETNTDDVVSTIQDTMQNNEEPERNLAKERKIELNSLAIKWKQEDTKETAELTEDEIVTKIDNRLNELSDLENKWSAEDSEVSMTPYETITYRSLKNYMSAMREKLEQDKTNGSGKYTNISFDSYLNAFAFITDTPYELTSNQKDEVKELLIISDKLGITKSNSISEIENDLVTIYSLNKGVDSGDSLDDSEKIVANTTGIIILDKYVFAIKHGARGYDITGGGGYNCSANLKTLENFTAAMEYGGFDITGIDEDENVVTIATKDLAANNADVDTDIDTAILNIYNNASTIVHQLRSSSNEDLENTVDKPTLWEIEKIRNIALHYALDNIDSKAFYTSLN